MNYNKATDNELIRACLKNKRPAQQELFTRFSYMVKGICLRYSRDADEAEDLLQESFIRIFTKLDTFTDKGPLGAWIRKITVNTALEIYRKHSTMQRHLTIVKAESDPNPKTSDSAIEQLQLEDLLLKIQQLPNGYRTIFNLYAIEGYNHPEIAQMLDISEGTSKSQYSRARTLLREMIDRESHVERIIWSHAT